MVKLSRNIVFDMYQVEDYWWLVGKVARRIGRRTNKWSVGELMSFGATGLMSAVRCFDEKHGWSFKRYAAYRIHGAIVDGMTTKQWHLAPESEVDVEWLGYLPWCSDAFDSLLAQVGPKLRIVLRAYYQQGLELKAIGGLLGVSESRVCQLLKEAQQQVADAVRVDPDLGTW